MKKLCILGATGSLGTQTLEVLSRPLFKRHIEIQATSAARQKEKLEKTPAKQRYLGTCAKELCRLIDQADIVVNVLPGKAGIEPSKHALKRGKTLLLGNKESVVVAGLNSPQIIPLDSEHNAIYEITKACPEKTLTGIILTCSGGPFWDCSARALEQVSATEALQNPRWQMGPKVSVESALLLNKGLEIIEAHYLFGCPLEKISVLVHPEARVHSLVRFAEDPLPYAYISLPDMREHIENALCRALELPVPPREVRPLDIQGDEFVFKKPLHPHLTGIEKVLKVFRKSPFEMKEFLAREEDLIQSFLKNEIGLLEILEQL